MHQKSLTALQLRLCLKCTESLWSEFVVTQIYRTQPKAQHWVKVTLNKPSERKKEKRDSRPGSGDQTPSGTLFTASRKPKGARERINFTPTAHQKQRRRKSVQMILEITKTKKVPFNLFIFYNTTEKTLQHCMQRLNKQMDNIM